MDQISYDIAIIGAGIAGASVAAALGDGVKVALVEQEQQPGYHSTGRSAAIYSPTSVSYTHLTLPTILLV